MHVVSAKDASGPTALSDDGSIALVNRILIDGEVAVSGFGFAHADGTWEPVEWEVHHPDVPVVSNSRANDMTRDGTIAVGTACLERPYPYWGPSDGRPNGQRLSGALTMSGDAKVLVGFGEYGIGASHYPFLFRPTLP